MTISTNPASIAGVNLAIVDTAAAFQPGTLVHGNYGGEWVYVQASAAIAAGDFVVISKDYAVSLLTTTNSPRGSKVGVCRTALANTEWGWVQTAGQAPGRTANAVAANARINTTATGGAVDDDGTGGAKEILGVGIPVAAAGATTNTEFTLTNPVVGVTLA